MFSIRIGDERRVATMRLIEEGDKVSVFHNGKFRGTSLVVEVTDDDIWIEDEPTGERWLMPRKDTTITGNPEEEVLTVHYRGKTPPFPQFT